MAKLKTYRTKRDFGKTSEPRGREARTKGSRYVIQKHDATRLHYDLRLELDGVMLSWAVTRGPSLVPGDKRLAIHVEDHPIEYNTFEGTIPEGEYGGGTVMVWDRGRWIPDGDPRQGMKKGRLDFEIDGEKLKGRWHLVRMRKRQGERQEPWLLIKAKDEYARTKSAPDILEEMSDSAATGRTMEEIAGARKKRVWHSNKAAKAPAKTSAKPSRTAKTPRKTNTRRSAALKAKAPIRKGKTRVPDFIPPTLATLSAATPEGTDWLHEIKFDGYRIQARIADGTVALKTRTGLDWTEKFPTIAEACAALTRHDAILDGEIVSGDEHGVSSFSGLQNDLKGGRTDRLAYYVFDLLHLDGADLTGAPLTERKAALERLLRELPENGAVRYSAHFDTEGALLLKHACQMHLEGIISKRSDAPYHSGRTGDWLKSKCSNSQELVVAGFSPSDVAPKRVRALVLGYHDKDGLQYAGRVGTGFTDKMRSEWWHRLEPLRRDKSPFGAVPPEERRRPVHWVEPRTVVEVDFRGWTHGGLVRQASLKGLREDKPAKQVVREVVRMPSKQAALRQKSPAKTSKPGKTAKPGKAAATTAATIAGVTLSHPDRVYWDDAGVTKQMLAEYYERVWEHMQPHVTGRVLAILRCPDGQTAACFFQKHATAGVDPRRLHLVREPDGDKAIAIDELEGLIALAQAGALEIHVRGSTIDHLEEADRLVFDLDPGPGIGWKEIIAAAREVRERLSRLKLESFVKTTGGKGLHVMLPIQRVPWDQAKNFCRRVAEEMVADSPERYVATVKKAAREKRIFVDYLRNSREATAIAPYSTRARPGATVSVPLTWDELGKQKVSNAFTVLNLSTRLAKMRKDAWADIGKVRQRLPK